MLQLRPEGEKPGLVLALLRAARRDPTNDNLSGSPLDVSETSYISFLIARCSASIPQISWYTSSGDWERSTLLDSF